jgi:hypothetical protein
MDFRKRASAGGCSSIETYGRLNGSSGVPLLAINGRDGSKDLRGDG